MSNANAIPLARVLARVDTRTVEAAVCWLLVVLVIFVNGADFRGANGEVFEVHWQIYLKLGVSALCGLVSCLLLFPQTYRALLSWPGLLVAMLTCWYGLCIPVGIEKLYCFACWAGVAGVTLFVPAAMRMLGAWGTMSAVAFGLALYVSVSWVVFLAFPEIGVAKEYVSSDHAIERMGGLGHPNELGIYCAFTVMVFLALGIKRRVPWIVVMPILCMAGAALLASFSRTAIAVTVLGSAIVLQDYWKKNALVPLMGGLLLAFAAFGLLATGRIDWIMDEALVKLSKSGASRELSSATGRDRIWQYGISQITESPLVGYGYGASRFVMNDYSFHCHNIVLNASMAGGVPAGILVVAQMFYCLWAMIFHPRAEIDGLGACILIGGLIESLLTTPVAAAQVFVWTMVIFWRGFDFRLAAEQLAAVEAEHRLSGTH